MVGTYWDELVKGLGVVAKEGSEGLGPPESQDAT